MLLSYHRLGRSYPRQRAREGYHDPAPERQQRCRLFGALFAPAAPVHFAAGIPMYQRIDLAPLAAGSAPIIEFTAITLDGSNTPIDLFGKLIRFIAFDETHAAGDCDPFDATLTPLFSYDTDAGGVALSGDNHNIATVTFVVADTEAPGHHGYWLLNVTDRLPLFRGKLPIRPAVWSM